MMEDDEDFSADLLEERLGHHHSRGNLLQRNADTAPSLHAVGAAPSMDDYIKESENALSAALGPRWDSKTLEGNAQRSTSALLRGISGTGKGLSALFR